MRHFKVGDEIRAVGPKQEHIIQGDWVELSEAELQAELQGKDQVPNPVEVRDAKLAALVHYFGDGRIIQCRPHPYIDESNMRNAIERMARTGETSREWYAADNTSVPITPAELQIAIESGQDQASVIWDEFLAETGA